MNLDTAQLVTLKTAINAETDQAFVALRTANNEEGMANWYNQPSTFTAWKPTVMTADVGAVVNYDAVGALTTANSSRVTLFYAMNPTSFDPSKADIRSFWDSTFSGALGGGGQATRDALTALWKRIALRGERIYCTGTGTDAAPGSFTLTGNITAQNISDALRA